MYCRVFQGKRLLKRRGLRERLSFGFVVGLLSMSPRSKRYEALVETTIAIAKMSTMTIAKFTRILWGVLAKATGAPRVAMIGVCCRSIEQVSNMLTPRGPCGHQLQHLYLKTRLLLSHLLMLKQWEVSVSSGGATWQR